MSSTIQRELMFSFSLLLCVFLFPDILRDWAATNNREFDLDILKFTNPNNEIRNKNTISTVLLSRSNVYCCTDIEIMVKPPTIATPYPTPYHVVTDERAEELLFTDAQTFCKKSGESSRVSSSCMRRCRCAYRKLSTEVAQQ